MDPRVWALLPDAIMDRVLAQLPVHRFFHFRVVCRRWNALPFTPAFLELRAEIPNREEWIMLLDYGFSWNGVFPYNPILNTWCSVPLDYLPDDFLHPVAGAGGLLCITGTEEGTICVCNPLTKTSRRLPHMLRKRVDPLVCFFEDKDRKHYKILATGADIQNSPQYDSSMELYDSRTDRWKVVGKAPRRPAKAFFLNGVFYFLIHPRPNAPFEICYLQSIMSFDIERKHWREIPVPEGALPVASPHLAERKGHLLMAGAIKNRTSWSLRIWEYNHKNREWKKLTHMPAKPFNQLFKQGFSNFECTGVGDYMCFSSPALRNVLLYDFTKEQGSWHWLDKFYKGPNHSSVAWLGFPFPPRLDAFV